MTILKKCCRCKQYLPATTEYFNRKSGVPDGLQGMCRRCSNASCRQWHKKNPKAHLKRMGVTQEDYDKMLLEQHHRCAICGEHEDNFQRDLHVDHCHITGQIRALLCTNCNTGLGMFMHSIKFLFNAIKYIIKFKWRKN